MMTAQMESVCDAIADNIFSNDMFSNATAEVSFRKDLVLQLIQQKEYRLTTDIRNFFITTYLNLFRLCTSILRTMILSDDVNSGTKALASFLEYTAMEVQHNLVKLIQKATRHEDRVAYLLFFAYAARLTATNQKDLKKVFSVYENAWEIARSNLPPSHPFFAAAFESLCLHPNHITKDLEEIER